MQALINTVDFISVHVQCTQCAAAERSIRGAVNSVSALQVVCSTSTDSDTLSALSVSTVIQLQLCHFLLAVVYICNVNI